MEALRLIGQSFDCPLLVNMAERGKTTLLPAHELEALGLRLVIFPGSLYRAAFPAMQRVLEEIKRAGTTQGILDQLLSFEGRNQIAGLARYYDLERRFLSPGLRFQVSSGLSSSGGPASHFRWTKSSTTVLDLIQPGTAGYLTRVTLRLEVWEVRQ